jgi:Mg2+/citrate symporter
VKATTLTAASAGSAALAAAGSTLMVAVVTAAILACFIIIAVCWAIADTERSKRLAHLIESSRGTSQEPAAAAPAVLDPAPRRSALRRWQRR